MNEIRPSTTITSRALRFTPGQDLSYKIDARTFSRQGKRPATSPAKFKLTPVPKKNTLSTSPEDIIAQEQFSLESMQKSYGKSLMILNKGFKKVKPGKFLELRKLMNQPAVLPLVESSTSTISTPRLVKNMVDIAKNAGTSTKKLKQPLKETQYDYRSQASKTSSAVSRSQLYKQFSETWESSGNHSSLSHSRTEDIFERCVRCSQFPDIQIEGESINRMLTSKNILMSKEHCEVLGFSLCPDCQRVRSQRSHEKYCRKNIPTIANDVYKIALVHERMPNLAKREIQRKFFDGEISDKLIVFPIWNKADSLTYLKNENLEENYAFNDEDPQIYLPDINDSKSRKPSNASNQADVRFETILEINETSSEEDTQPTPIIIDGVPETKEMIYRRYSLEEPQQIQIIPAADEVKPDDGRKELKFHSEDENKIQYKDTTAVSISQKVNVANQTNNAYKPISVYKHKRSNQRCFTVNVIPSKNFFFNISDLAERLQHSGIIKSQRSTSRLYTELLYSSKTATKHDYTQTHITMDKTETDSISSNDSLRPVNHLNMYYEPPVLCNYKNRYFPMSRSSSRRSSIISKT